jgi:Fis family transcriptional regulator
MKNKHPLGTEVKASIKQYLEDLNGEKPANLHQFFLGEVEKPFLEVIMEYVEGNQTKASDILGINRNTLRKKLKSYDISL